MKLLFCDICYDVFKLNDTLRTCECGRVKGKYLKNKHNAVVNGKGYAVAIGNGSFIQAIMALNSKDPNSTKDDFIEACRIEYAWVRPHSGLGNPRTLIKEDL